VTASSIVHEGPVEARETFVEHVDSAGAARRFVASVLTEWGMTELIPDATLVVSELVVNAVLHARSTTEVVLRRETGGVAMEVIDSSPIVPTRRAYDTHAVTGRGLQIVDALAPGWTAQQLGAGKVIRTFLPVERPDFARRGSDL
jgi:anti-sigma regulatory factor (Ser/Thr protein kinase)